MLTIAEINIFLNWCFLFRIEKSFFSYNNSTIQISFYFIFLAQFIIFNAIARHSLEDNGLKANSESCTKKKRKGNILWLTTNNYNVKCRVMALS